MKEKAPEIPLFELAKKQCSDGKVYWTSHDLCETTSHTFHYITVSLYVIKKNLLSK